ncbi:BrnT family toxin [Roseivivax sediminis]|uniref:Uncharacterized protein n=1 Tax=Roseivivax sediminis TaxID=936889 RepID=A0A1I1YSN1_9RHOB|nr:BrnT family toxin [Roseivivax sediminis]SFE22556.1 hypothetical protein SAMN04515678_107193 [Roseivivax sediminis]
MWEWDEAKNRHNIAARGIDFADARRIDWSTAQIFTDDRTDYGEDRFLARGTIDGRLHILVYTLRDDRLRVISLRKANRRERRAYVAETGRSLGSL